MGGKNEGWGIGKECIIEFMVGTVPCKPMSRWTCTFLSCSFLLWKKITNEEIHTVDHKAVYTIPGQTEYSRVGMKAAAQVRAN